MLPALILSIFIPIFAAIGQQPLQYERKSISFLDAVLVPNPEIQLSDAQIRFFLGQVQNAVEMERFDYNPLPSDLTRDFVTQVNQTKSTDLSQITPLLEQNIVSKISEVVTADIERRAAELVSPEEQMSFAVSKAKTLGITAEELEKVLNSAYIYFPVLNSCKFDVSEGSGMVTVTLDGSLLWYSVKLTGMDAGVRLLMDSKPVKAIAFGSFETKDKKRQEIKAAIEWAKAEAFDMACVTFGSNAQVMVRSMRDFQLVGTVKEANWKGITFNLGKKEGVHLNDKYIITSYIEDDGEVKEERAGYVEVTKVGLISADSTYMNYTRARVVKGLQFDEGMNVLEYPQLGISISVAMMSFNVKYEATDPAKNYLVNVADGHSKPGFGFKLMLDHNTAPWSGLSHFYILLEGGIGGVDINAVGADGLEVGAASFLTYSLGVMKKYPFRSLYIPFRFLLGVQDIQITAGWPISGLWTEQLTLRNTNIGFTFGTGCEWEFSPAISVALDADWRAYTKFDDWKLMRSTHLDEDDVEHIDTFPGPAANASGLVYSLSVVYRPPTLQFNPMSLLTSRLIRS